MGDLTVKCTRLLVVVGLVLGGGALTAGQQTFKGGTRTVAVYATVTDQIGRLVPDLAREDFEVFDNGKHQDLTVFAHDTQPITLVMMLDRSASMAGNFALVEYAAEEFVRHMQPQDRARIGSFSNRIQIDPEDFTSDHEELRKILRTELQPEGPTPLWNAVNVAITALLHQQGRRVVLVFTDGADSPMNFRNNNSSMKDVMKRAEEDDVMVYAIGLASSEMPRGRPRQGGYGGGGRGGGHGGMGGFGRGRGGTITFGQMNNGKPDEGLKKIAEQTGGGYFELTSANDLATTFTRVVEELHQQYVLGFTPVVLDGKIHKLDVRARGTGMTPRARKSYLAAKERETTTQ